MSRILIVGGSLGGLLAANLLSRAGHDVTVLEKSTQPLDGRGAGIVTHAALMRALRLAGATVDAAFGVEVQTRVVLDRQGDVVASLALPQVLTSWSRLYQLLYAILPPTCHKSGTVVVSVQQDQESVRAVCADGSVFCGDLLIASDGLRSAVRSQFAPTVLPRYAGYVGWRGVCDEAVLSRATLDSVFDCFGFGLPDGEQLIGYPVAGKNNTTVRGQRRFNFVWYRPASDAGTLAALLSDDDGNHYPLGIPPNRISWRQLAAMREAASVLLAPQFAEIIHKTAQPFLQPICDVASSQIAFGRTLLMGDAAFVARPHVGMGVTKAAEDAMAIAQAIAQYGATADAGLAYQAARLAAGQTTVERGRQLGSYMQTSDSRSPTPRDAMQVLRDTAIDVNQPTQGRSTMPLTATACG
jgi:2-polyprenyl-6-methoxyphenol hydroxylase-like FAD-dependent oxidoreductase